MKQCGICPNTNVNLILLPGSPPGMLFQGAVESATVPPAAWLGSWCI